MPNGHAVFDGSNIATEGRSEPSIDQLREAVAAFADEYDFEIVTVIVDASFEHRVGNAERTAARAAIDANEIITPPAGVIGRGDTFILQVADRANAVVVSNDSFQEFHGTYTWLFDEGRLIGGKPIPGLGWVFVPRAPVKGPVSRRARAQAGDDGPAKTPASKPRPAKKASAKKAAKKSAVKNTTKKAAKKSSRRRGKRSGDQADKSDDRARSNDAATVQVPGANPPGVWKAFRRDHPLGSRVRATVESFSSHGAYARAGEASVYLPLRLLGDPMPRRARDAVTVGEVRHFIVHRFDEERRGIDAGIIPFDGSSDQTEASTQQSDLKTPTKGRTVAAKKAAKKATRKSAKKAPAKKAGAKKAAKKAPAKKAGAKKAAKKSTKKAAKKAPAKKAGAKKAAKKSGAKKAAKKSTKKAAKKSTKKAAKKAPAKKAGAKKAAKKSGAKKAAKKSAAKKTTKKAAKKRR